MSDTAVTHGSLCLETQVSEPERMCDHRPSFGSEVQVFFAGERGMGNEGDHSQSWACGSFPHYSSLGEQEGIEGFAKIDSLHFSSLLQTSSRCFSLDAKTRVLYPKKIFFSRFTAMVTFTCSLDFYISGTWGWFYLLFIL